MGLRGAKQTTGAAPLYWKGKETKVPVTPDEIKLFRVAVEQARAGQKTDAVATLKTFQTTYPHSLTYAVCAHILRGSRYHSRRGRRKREMHRMRSHRPVHGMQG